MAAARGSRGRKMHMHTPCNMRYSVAPPCCCCPALALPAHHSAPAPVAGALGRVHQLVCEALADGLDVAERRLARARGQQPDGLVDAAQRANINSLAAHHTGRANARGVLPGAAAAATGVRGGAAAATAGQGQEREHEAGRTRVRAARACKRPLQWALHACALLLLQLPPLLLGGRQKQMLLLRAAAANAAVASTRRSRAASKLHTPQHQTARHCAAAACGCPSSTAAAPAAAAPAAAAPVDDGIHHDLDGVLVRQQVDDVKRVLHDAHLQHVQSRHACRGGSRQWQQHQVRQAGRSAAAGSSTSSAA